MTGSGNTVKEISPSAVSFIYLATETVKGATLALEGVDDIERGDSLAFGVLSVGDSVTDDTLKEGLEDTTGLFIDHYCVP